MYLENEKEVFFELFGKKEESEPVMSCPVVTGAFPKSTPLAMAYVPFQTWEEPYDEETALCRGTIFAALDKPFIGEEAVKNAPAK